MPLRNFMRQETPTPPTARVPRGLRVYAVGDVHGRLDLLDGLLASIEADTARRRPAKTVIVMLGDLIDRGPESRGVVERLRGWHRSQTRLVVLSGNHEEVLLRILGGETGLLASWLSFGGAQCLASYGVDVERLFDLGAEDALAVIREAIPREHQAFLESCVDTVRIGDYLFVHAGIRPAVDLAEQDQQDLRWIRQPFLDDDSDHGFIVVHGHTISEDVVERPNRIGLDTGAYVTGRLSAIGLEEDRRWFLEAVEGLVPVD